MGMPWTWMMLLMMQGSLGTFLGGLTQMFGRLAMVKAMLSFYCCYFHSRLPLSLKRSFAALSLEHLLRVLAAQLLLGVCVLALLRAWRVLSVLLDEFPSSLLEAVA